MIYQQCVDVSAMGGEVHDPLVRGSEHFGIFMSDLDVKTLDVFFNIARSELCP